ncbi:MAG: 5-dehydro-4-deoxy-D-glucuronate isomerase [Alphaproteobacteria bacterium]|nr:5-dehydro-4-deoxy-D-glucuronate isomerase [Alphaproteobacteria bacterium]
MTVQNYSSRNAIDPVRAAAMDTTALRENFLIENMFVGNEINLTYSHYDRLVIGGAMPADEMLALAAVKSMGTKSFLDRRELAVFNIGARGTIKVGPDSYVLDNRDMIYIGMGAGEVSFASADAGDPAKFYLISAPAHATYPTKMVQIGDAKRIDLGAQETSNQRSIFQFVHPEGIKTCQLVVGMTTLATGSIWNTMPAHVHDRRSEAYLYFGMAPTARVFHFMGEPQETRHIVVKSDEAVLSPVWSIHCGAATSNYTFIWAMAGDNVDYTDIDPVPLETMK